LAALPGNSHRRLKPRPPLPLTIFDAKPGLDSEENMMKQAKARLLQNPTDEPKDQRRPLKMDDFRLSAEAKNLLESLAPDLRPSICESAFGA